MAVLTRLGIGKANTTASGDSRGSSRKRLLVIIAGSLVALTVFLVLVFGTGGDKKTSESDYVAKGLHQVSLGSFSFWVPEGYGLTGSDFGTYTFGNDVGDASDKPEVEIKKYVPYSKASANTESNGASVELLRILNEARFTRNGSKVSGMETFEKSLNGNRSIEIRINNQSQTDPTAETRKYFIEQPDGFIWSIKIKLDSVTDKEFIKRVDLIVSSLESKVNHNQNGRNQ